MRSDFCKKFNLINQENINDVINYINPKLGK